LAGSTDRRNTFRELLSWRLIEQDFSRPGEIQNTTLMAAGIVATSQTAGAARAFIAFISSPIAAAVFKAGGFQPVDSK
jgi:hypothetical protein